ncbi:MULTISPECIES: YiiG family protein [Cellulophaga]|uniref:DUF3829 domain-containing protein n=2 Tax=Cellulophaga TaxID=104264 RepID=F0RAS5_CELLC|nr:MULTISPECIES: YiiG family protein [Cellulophaga]ADY29481.1 hypothetical protein Celly_1657 [Cellulophaga lytica DSM 7489]APU10364.1 hypothetical protein A5M85_08740 [Cellulophaga lytica]EWH13857.1 hypothetical protein KLA_07392 [Cellulophaga geojensis KL-A]MDO6852270.1 YiiG family protein [Cellulophaga lytica]WQG76345.1 YiiG family protein [Cellulophaga lytica]
MKNYLVHTCLIAFVFVSCKNIKQEKDDKGMETVTSSLEPFSSDEKKLVVSTIKDAYNSTEFVVKYNNYIEFFNTYDDKVRKSYANYLSWVNQKETSGTTNLKSKIGLPLEELNILKSTIVHSPAIKKVDANMLLVYKTAEILYNTILEVDAYYKKGIVESVDVNKTKKLHIKLLEAYRNYFSTFDDMSIVFYRLQDDVEKYKKEKYKEQELVVQYNLFTAINATEAILNEIGGRDVDGLLTLDFTVINQKIKELRAAYVALEGLKENQDLIVKEFGKPMPVVTNFTNHLGNILMGLTSLKLRIANNDFDYGKDHPNIAADGSPLKLELEFIAMVNEYRSIN